jgi:hypothetical protein
VNREPGARYSLGKIKKCDSTEPFHWQENFTVLSAYLHEQEEETNNGRVYNFFSGPSMLPEPVLRKAAAEMLDYQEAGQSVMEMSNRSQGY